MPKRFMQQRDMQVQSEHRLSHARAFSARSMERADLVRLHRAYPRNQAKLVEFEQCPLVHEARRDFAPRNESNL